MNDESVSAWIDGLKQGDEAAANELWKLLFTITERKSFRQVDHERRQKRGGGNVRGESILGNVDDRRSGGIDQMNLDLAPTPESAVAIAENVAILLNVLGDETLRRLALVKMEGYTNQEIAEELGCSDRSVKRKLKVIRSMWMERALA